MQILSFSNDHQGGGYWRWAHPKHITVCKMVPSLLWLYSCNIEVLQHTVIEALCIEGYKAKKTMYYYYYYTEYCADL